MRKGRSGVTDLLLQTGHAVGVEVLRHLLKCLSSFCGCAGPLVLRGLTLVAASRGYSLVVMHGILNAVASIAAEHGLWVHRRR